MAKKKKIKTRDLIGRDPTKGIPDFKTGIVPSKKNKQKNRKSKNAIDDSV